jgi:hypothetical protein
MRDHSILLMHRITLTLQFQFAQGRSPYEPPEPALDGHGASASATHADGYTQEYDERGHPVNPSAKALARQLRKAKNDILSTMGIVVSGEDAAGSRREQQKSKLIAEENDYGLAMATIDQVVMFVCPWWITSFASRIQVGELRILYI